MSDAPLPAAHSVLLDRSLAFSTSLMSASDHPPTTSRGGGLGQVLISLRTERGLPQKQVAREANIDNSTLSRLESGDRGVSREVLGRICDVLDLTRQERLDVLAAAGYLTDEAAQILADDQLAQFARLLNDPGVDPDDATRLRQFLDLALAFAKARGYRSE